MSNNLQAHIEKYIAVGWSFFRLPYGKKEAAEGWKQFQTEHPNDSDIEAILGNGQCNLAIVTGAISGLVAVDCDTLEAENALREHLDGRQLINVTGRGTQYLFNHPGGKVPNKVGLIPGLDLRGDGGYIVAPPSKHPSGKVYEWSCDFDDFGTYPLPDLPDWILDLMQPPVTAQKQAAAAPAPSGGVHTRHAQAALYGSDNTPGELAILARAIEGQRNKDLNKAAFNLGQLVGAGEVDRGLVEYEIIRIGQSLGLSEREVLATTKSGLDAGEEKKRPASRLASAGNRPGSEQGRNLPPLPPANGNKPPALPAPISTNLTDLGNARRLIKLHGANLRYVHPWKSWLIWNGIQWGVDDTGGIERLAKDTIRHMYHEAGEIEDDKERQRLAGHALKTEAASRISNMIKLAQSEEAVIAKIEQLDADGWLLNTENCIIDLRTGVPYEHDRTLLQTKVIGTAYDPDATCYTWEKFIHRITDGNTELASFLQRAVGYSLTGLNTEEVLFFLYGTGGNGKSKFTETLRELLKDYATHTPTQTIMRKNNETISNDIARLRGARFVTAVETEENQRLAESLIKQMTGGDKMTARFLFAEPFEFTPIFKLWLSGNHKPTIGGQDPGIWRRILLVPFLVTIPVHERDHNLLPKLLAELPGILNWAIMGCLEWQRIGLSVPKVIADATQSYRTEMDVIAAFISDCCVTSPTAVVSSGDLYDAYKAWCDDNGERVITQRTFGMKLGDRGFVARKSMSKRLWSGLGLLSRED